MDPIQKELRLPRAQRLVEWLLLLEISFCFSCDSVMDQSFLDHPVGESFSPSMGTSLGGDKIQISGRKLEDVVEVTFGDSPGEILALESLSLAVRTPAHSVSSVVIKLTDASGEIFQFADPFRFLPSQIRFETNTVLEGSSYGIVAGKFDADDLPDLAKIDFEGSNPQRMNVMVGIGQKGGSPGFQFSSVYSAGTRFKISPDEAFLHAIDLNRDGLDDLVLYNWFYTGDLTDGLILINQRDGSFSTQPFPNQKLEDSGFHPADYDGDGAIDLAWFGNAVLVLWGAVQNPFAEKATLEIWPEASSNLVYNWGVVYSSRTYQKSENSLPQLLAMNLEQQEIVSVQFDGQRNPTVTRKKGPMPYQQVLGLVDIMGDYFPDALYTNKTGSIFVARALPGLEFADAIEFPLSCKILDPDWSIEVLRMQSYQVMPGIENMLLYSLNEPSCLLFSNGARGILEDGWAIPRNPTAANERVLWTDLNGDGLRDVLRVDSTGFGDIIRYALYFGPTMGGLPPLSIKLKEEYEVLDGYPLLQDVNQDGVRELISLTQNHTLFEAAFQDGYLSKASTLDYFSSMTPTRLEGMADFNGDGLLDILLRTSPSSEGVRAMVLLQRSDGSFDPAIEVDLDSWHFIAFGYFLGPSKAVLVGCNNSDKTKWEFVVFDSQGGFTKEMPFAYDLDDINCDPVESVTLADLNNDSIGDLLESCQRDPLKIKKGQLKGGTFQLESYTDIVNVDHGLNYPPILLDIDDDGDVDMVSSGSQGVFELLLNNGQGGFDERWSRSLGAEFVFQGMADVDGDQKHEFLLFVDMKQLVFVRWSPGEEVVGPFLIGEWPISLYSVNPFDSEARGFYRQADFNGDGLNDLLMMLENQESSIQIPVLIRNSSW